MNKLKIRLYDTNFSHHAPGSSISSFPGHDVFSEFIEWVRDPKVYTDIAFFTDNCLSQVDNCDSKYKFAWIIEPRVLVPSVYNQIENPELYNKFAKVLTHDSKLLELDEDKFVPCPLFGAWISKEDVKIYHPKTKNICMIVSHKRQLEGHNLRHEIVSKLSEKYNIDVYGNGYKPFDKMVDVLKDYRYCIVVENCKDGYWITEKLTTPILCGCYPIYWGSSKADWYGLNGIEFNTLEKLENVLSNLNESYYQSLLSWEGDIGDIFYNWQNAQKNMCLEDWIYDWILWPWMEKEGLLGQLLLGDINENSFGTN